MGLMTKEEMKRRDEEGTLEDYLLDDLECIEGFDYGGFEVYMSEMRKGWEKESEG